MKKHQITEKEYTLADIKEIVRSGQGIFLSEQIKSNICSGADYIKKIQGEERLIYGVNTGFGSLCNTKISEDNLSELQHRQLVSHACGVGKPISQELSRLVMFLKILTFRTGHCGISLEVVQRLVDFLNNRIIPVIPQKGTVGASGDLAPLAHMSLPIIGLGSMFLNNKIVDASTALSAVGLEPMILKPKEGLALTNGIQYLDAMAVECLWNIEELIKSADLIAAFSMQGFSTANTFYQVRLHRLSKHKERIQVANNLNNILAGSNHHCLPQCDPPKEDPYSFRCVPQVHGAVRKAFYYAKEVIENDCNSVSDNPLFFAETDEVLTCGNLHGASPALIMDHLAASTTILSNISERRTYQLLSGQHGLPPYLIKTPGLNSGLMIPQYTSAALLNENKVLSTPASIDTIMTCHLQEDHVSMGGTSGYKLQQIIENTEYILGIELLTAMQANSLNPGLIRSPFTEQIYNAFRQVVPVLEDDRFQGEDIEKAVKFLCANRSEWSKDLE